MCRKQGCFSFPIFKMIFKIKLILGNDLVIIKHLIIRAFVYIHIYKYMDKLINVYTYKCMYIKQYNVYIYINIYIMHLVFACTSIATTSFLPLFNVALFCTVGTGARWVLISPNNGYFNGI
jgi:hypothetical protein